MLLSVQPWFIKDSSNRVLRVNIYAEVSCCVLCIKNMLYKWMLLSVQKFKKDREGDVEGVHPAHVRVLFVLNYYVNSA